MKIIRAKDYADMSRKAANIISAQVIMKPNCVLGLATGGTPVGAEFEILLLRFKFRKADLCLNSCLLRLYPAGTHPQLLAEKFRHEKKPQ